MSNIEPFGYDSFQNVYIDYVPAITNLYKVEIFSLTTDDSPIREYLAYHATSVGIGGQSLTLERDPITKLFKLKNKDAYSRIETITVTWRESDDWRVRKYHENWLHCFYNPEGDYYLSYAPNELGKADLIRKIKITLPKAVSQDKNKVLTSSSPFNKTKVKDLTSNLNSLEFLVLPNTVGNIDLSWTSSPNIVSHQITYYVQKFNWNE